MITDAEGLANMVLKAGPASITGAVAHYLQAIGARTALTSIATSQGTPMSPCHRNGPNPRPFLRTTPRPS